MCLFGCGARLTKESYVADALYKNGGVVKACFGIHIFQMFGKTKKYIAACLTPGQGFLPFSIFEAERQNHPVDVRQAAMPDFLGFR